MDAKLKLIHEVVYYVPDQRPASPTPIFAQGFIIDKEAGDKIVSSPREDRLTFTERRKDFPETKVTVVVPRGAYLYRMDRVFYRKRSKKEDEQQRAEATE